MKSDPTPDLPVTIRSSENKIENYNRRPRTESFSLKHIQNTAIPNSLVYELALIYKSADGKYSQTTNINLDKAIDLLLEFIAVSGNRINLIRELSSAIIYDFHKYITTKNVPGWVGKYECLRTLIRPMCSADWPKVQREVEPTEGLSVAAAAAMRNALKLEIDRIRQKLGRFNNAMRTGHVLKNLKLKGNHPAGIAETGLQEATGDDILKTILHYCPRFPLGRERSNGSRANKNIGQELIQRVYWAAESGRKHLIISKKICEFFPDGMKSLLDRYFPTRYDAICVMLFVGLETGWNRETVASIGRDALNLRFQANRAMEIFGDDYAVLEGVAVKALSGFKLRGQNKKRPKKYTHISDLNDPYGIYSVLKDFDALAAPLRRIVNDPIAASAIILCCGNAGSSPYGYFGPSGFSRGVTIEKGNPNVQEFFRNHKIFMDGDADDPQCRVKTVNWRVLRTTYETVLEGMGLPLYIRRMLLGHTSIDTSMLYGSDMQATQIQMKKLGEILNSVEEDYAIAKTFQGVFMCPEDDPRRKPKESGNVVTLFTDWQDNYVMVCNNKYKPSWPGHDRVVKHGQECQSLRRCLYCKQSMIGKESLPHLIQWSQEIDEYFGSPRWENDISLLELQDVIQETLELWMQERDPSDIEEAARMLANPDFPRVSLWLWADLTTR